MIKILNSRMFLFIIGYEMPQQVNILFLSLFIIDIEQLVISFTCIVLPLILDSTITRNNTSKENLPNTPLVEIQSILKLKTNLFAISQQSGFTIEELENPLLW